MLRGQGGGSSESTTGICKRVERPGGVQRKGIASGNGDGGDRTDGARNQHVGSRILEEILPTPEGLFVPSVDLSRITKKRGVTRTNNVQLYCYPKTDKNRALTSLM